MKKFNPLLLTDFYKVHHHNMYPKGTNAIYSNLTPRKSRIPGVNHIVFFGLQYFIKEYLIDQFNKYFFAQPIEDVLTEYRDQINVDTSHIEALHRLKYLPIEIKALPEGTVSPIGVPVLTIRNTHPGFFWLTNYIETLMSATLWQAITSATIAHEYKKILTFHAKESGDPGFVMWQGHDFSMRGMSSVESAILSGMGHLLSFKGTDTIPAIYALKEYYNAQGLIGASVPATEHSVMCMGQKDSEIDTFRTLLEAYPTGILSVVSDTWDLWKVLTDYLPQLKEQILARDGKLVIRPDSGDPVNILCGTENGHLTKWEDAGESYQKEISQAEHKGVIELLWDVFGGKINSKGYKELDSHIGAIYGDSITLDRADQISVRLKAKGFASTNVVFGIGSFTYQYNTRDTFGFAVKATYGEVDGVGREIFKSPITDDGTKRSAKGLLQVYRDDGALKLKDQCTKEEESQGELRRVFLDGFLTRENYLDEIIENIER